MADLIQDKISQYDNPVILQQQARRSLINDISKATACDVAVIYHNLASQYSMLDDTDAEWLEGFLSQHPPKRPLLLIINSNGGLPLAAERLVHIARTYAPRGFRTLVADRAKSAATMVCLGADRIYMTKTAELGPIDPQIIGFDRNRRISIDSYLRAYDNLMNALRALDMNKENPAGLFHQLNRFDAAHVEEMRTARELGRDMARNFLASYMLKGRSKRKIDNVVTVFSEASQHKSHGRPIWSAEARKHSLKVTDIRLRSPFWNATYELVRRYNHLCDLRAMIENTEMVKIFESYNTTHELRFPKEASIEQDQNRILAG